MTGSGQRASLGDKWSTAGAWSVEKPDSGMAALSMLEVRDTIEGGQNTDNSTAFKWTA